MPAIPERYREAMNYIDITGKCEEADESSYTNKSTRRGRHEDPTLPRPPLHARPPPGASSPSTRPPSPTLLERWELEEAWVVVSCESMRALTFERSNARAGEKAIGALVVFQAVEAREVTADERKQLQARARHRRSPPSSVAPPAPPRRPHRSRPQGMRLPPGV